MNKLSFITLSLIIVALIAACVGTPTLSKDQVCGKYTYHIESHGVGIKSASCDENAAVFQMENEQNSIVTIEMTSESGMKAKIDEDVQLCPYNENINESFCKEGLFDFDVIVDWPGRVKPVDAQEATGVHQIGDSP